MNIKKISIVITLLLLATGPMQAMEQNERQVLEERKKARNVLMALTPAPFMVALLVFDWKTTYHDNTLERMLPLDDSAVFNLITRKPGILGDFTDLVVKTNETNGCYAGFESECIASNLDGKTCEYRLVDLNGEPMIHEFCYSLKSSYPRDALAKLRQALFGKNNKEMAHEVEKVRATLSDDDQENYGICQPERYN